MAFSTSTFLLLAQENVRGVSWFDYTTSDNAATVLGAGYFNDVANAVDVGDKIFITASDALIWARITTADKVVTIQGVVTTGAASSVALFSTLYVPTNDPLIVTTASIVTLYASTATITNASIGSEIVTTSSVVTLYASTATIATASVITLYASTATIATASVVTLYASTASIATISLTGGQLTFPATQVPSADVNTLDDYEEGTFTPAFAFGGGTTGITYTTQQGTYTKIGRSVIFSLRITITNNGSSTGVATITGLPFTSAATYSTACGIWYDNFTLVADLTAKIGPGVATIDLWDSPVAALTDAGVNNDADVIVSGAYFV